MTKHLLKFILVVTALLCASNTFAYDFEVDGLYFNIMSTADRTCCITYQSSRTQGDTWFYENDYAKSELIIPSTVQYLNQTLTVIKIDRNAFANNTYIKSVTIPTSIIYLDYSCFANCSNLNIVNIEDSTTPLQCNSYRYFYNCPLKNVYIGRELSYQEKDDSSWGWNGSIVANNSSVEEIVISPNLKTIHQEMFVNCSSLKTINLSSNNTIIGKKAFYGCSNLVSLGYIKGITTINENAFQNCSALKSLNFDNVTILGDFSFDGCTSLESITLNDELTNIPSYCFNGCTSLKDFIIPANVNSIGEYAFNGCNSIASITIPGSVNSIDRCAFAGCPIEDMTFQYGPKSLSTSYKDYDPVNNPTYFIWGEYINSTIKRLIVDRSFVYPMYFSNVETFIIDSKSQDITYNSIDLTKSTNLTSIYCNSAIPPKWQPKVTNQQYMNVKVYVPKGTLDAYKSSDWNNYWNLIESEELSTITVNIADEYKIPISYYLLNGVQIHEEPTKGIYIRKQGNTIIKVIK